MKWPREITLIRHDTSVYNVLKGQKEKDLLYKDFLVSWKEDIRSEKTLRLAGLVWEKYHLKTGDSDTELVDSEGRQAFETGAALSKTEKLSDVIFVSPYLRTKDTLRHIIRGWPELTNVKTVEEERIGEQEHGLSALYNDWRVFHVFHPEQSDLRKIHGSYWYKHPQGENVPDVRERNRSFIGTLTREYSDKRVLAVTHHFNILAMRANFERLGEKEFKSLDDHEKPIDCEVTCYEGDPLLGSGGRLVLSYYNRKLYA